MIEVGGKQFITLDDDLYVDGQKVTAAYVDGTRVYPETNGNGVTCIEALFVRKARFEIYGAIPYLYVDWGDGTTLYRSNVDADARLAYVHEYEDYDMHKVTICAKTGRFGGLEFRSVYDAAGSTQPCPSPESYARWCGRTYGIEEPGSPVLRHQRDFLIAYAGTMIVWDINPKPPTINGYVHTASEERTHETDTTYTVSVKFGHLMTFGANETWVYYDGLKLQDWWIF